MTPDYSLSYNNLGNIFKILNQCKIKNVIFLGSIKKIPLLKIRPNLITLFYLLNLVIYYNRGDSFLLKK